MADLLGTGTVKKTVYNRTEEIHFVFFYSFYLSCILSRKLNKVPVIFSIPEK